MILRNYPDHQRYALHLTEISRLTSAYALQYADRVLVYYRYGFCTALGFPF